MKENIILWYILSRSSTLARQHRKLVFFQTFISFLVSFWSNTGNSVRTYFWTFIYQIQHSKKNYTSYFAHKFIILTFQLIFNSNIHLSVRLLLQPSIYSTIHSSILPFPMSPWGRKVEYHYTVAIKSGRGSGSNDSSATATGSGIGFIRSRRHWSNNSRTLAFIVLTWVGFWSFTFFLLSVVIPSLFVDNIIKVYFYVNGHK